MSNDHETHPENLQRGGLWYGTLALAVLIVCMIAVHVSFLRAPYFWDETYFAPAAHDVLATGSLIPISVPVESHPPLVYVWVALWWKLFGFSIAVARISMLAVAMFTLVGVYRLARLFTTGTVPILVTLLTAIYPVFFAESTMVQLDMAAAGLTVWALVAYLRGRRWETAVLFSLAVLAKETAIVAPAVIAGLEIVMALRECKESIGERIRAAWQASYPMLLPLASLLCWFGWMYHKTGTPFGDTGYVQYNTGGSLRPMRMALAGAQHLYHLLIYLNLFVLTGLAAIVCVVTRPRASAESAARTKQSRMADARRGGCGICCDALAGGRSNAGAVFVAGVPAGGAGLRCGNQCASEMVAGDRGGDGDSVRSGVVPVHEPILVPAGRQPGLSGFCFIASEGGEVRCRRCGSGWPQREGDDGVARIERVGGTVAGLPKRTDGGSGGRYAFGRKIWRRRRRRSLTTF